MEFIVAKCPNCSGDLQLQDEKKQVKCKYCGFDIVVREAVDKAQANVDNLLKLASSAQETGNYQEGYDYFTKVLEFDADNYLAHWGKGICAAKLSTPEKFRFDELKTGIVNAVKNAPDDKKEYIEAKASKELYSVCKDNRKINITDTQRLDGLEIIHSFEPENIELIETIIKQSLRNSERKEKYLNKLEALAPEKAKRKRKAIEAVDIQYREENAKERKKKMSQRKFNKFLGKTGDISVIVLPIIITLGVILFCAIFCRTGR